MSKVLDLANDLASFEDNYNFTNGTYSGNFATQTMFRNKIINGDMRIDQRNAGNSSTVNGAYTIDRWGYGTAIADKMTWGQNYNSINPPAGFTNYFGMKTTTAYTVGASEFFLFQHKIEGYNVADLKWGTSSAKTITMSFWVNSSLTGTFGLVLSNSAQDRSYPLTYTISLANTWEYKTITIPGETTGTWNTNNGTGLQFYFGLGVGTNFNGATNNWNTTLHLGATGATSVVGTQDATWNITGVQLEEGSVATPFEHHPIGMELSLCQRYFEKSYNIEDTPGTSTYNGIHTNGGYYSMPASNYGTRPHTSYKVTKRGSTTVKTYDSAGNLGKCNYPDNVTNQSFTVIHSGQSGFSAETSTLSGGTDGRCYWQWTVESEL